MKRFDGGTTSPTLLDRVRDGRDHPAWGEFFRRYDPLLRQWCRYYRLDDESADELCQRTWQRLWPRMRTFQYDPSLRFRSWLRRFFDSRAMDMLKERNATTLVSLEALNDAGSCLLVSSLEDIPIEDAEPGDEDRSRRLLLLTEGEKVQEHIKARVDPATWHAFWMTKVEGRPFAEVAGLLGKSYAAVYYGSLRVLKMLRREGERRLGDSEFDAPILRVRLILLCGTGILPVGSSDTGREPVPRRDEREVFGHDLLPVRCDARPVGNRLARGDRIRVDRSAHRKL